MRRLFRCLPLCLLTLLLPASFLRAEAPFNFDATPGKLPKDIVPVQYDLQLAPDIEKRTFSGQESITIEVKQPTSRCVFNAQDLAVTAPELTPLDADGKPKPDAIKPTVALDADQQTCTLTFPAELAAGKYQLTLHFTGKINSDGGGLFASTYTGAEGQPETMLCTQMEPTDARRMFPCWDEPSFRAKFKLTVEDVPSELTVVSNLPGSQGKVARSHAAWTFDLTPPMASYLVVLAIGNFDTIEGKADGIPIRVIAPKGRVQNGKYALESAEKILHYYDDYFGVKFPLPKLDLIAVSGGGSFGGAMENWGGIVFAESALLYDPATGSQAQQERIFEVIAHEMAHQWFGDLVTMAWWDNLWLNEGFAEWMGESTTDHFNPNWQYWSNIADNRNEALTSDALSTTHPIQQPVASEMDAERQFDEITYNKGQAFIRMLENYLGHDRFRDGLRAYMQAHAYGNTTTADLWAALGAATGEPVSDIAAGWTEQPGFPLVSVSRDPTKPDALDLTQHRFTVHDPAAAPLHWKIPVTYAFKNLAGATGRFLLEGNRTETAPDGNPPVKFNLEGTGYYRVNYDDALLHRLLDSLDDLSAPDQVNLLSDAWAGVRANLTPVTNYLNLVQTLRPAETNPLVWKHVCGVNDRIDALYVGGDPAARKTWHEAMVAVLNPVWEHYGWETKENESAPDKELRSALIRQLGFFGDSLIISAAQERFAAFLKDPSALPPDIRAAVCDVVGRYADTATYNALLAQARLATGDDQKQLFYYALACANDPALAERTLALTDTDEIQGSFATRLLRAVATNGERPAEALKFTQGHLEKLLTKVSPMAKHLLVPNLYASFNETSQAEALEKDAKAPDTIDDPAQVKKSAEQIRVAADLKARLLPEINRWATGK